MPRSVSPPSKASNLRVILGSPNTHSKRGFSDVIKSLGMKRLSPITGVGPMESK